MKRAGAVVESAMNNDCEHPGFAARVETHRLTDDAGRVRNFVAEVSISCATCGLPFHFVGPSTGYSFHRPTVDVPATTLHAPIAPGERPVSDVGRISFEMPPKGES